MEIETILETVSSIVNVNRFGKESEKEVEWV